MPKTTIKLPIGLCEKILKRINKEKRFLVIRHCIIFSVMLVLSAGSFVPVIKIFLQQASQSGFINFASLMFSDFSIVMVYWKSFTLALFETMPALSFALVLLVLVIFLQSLRYLSKNINIAFKYGHLAPAN